MRWEDESYIRWYRRNTPEWWLLSWQARGLFGLIMRECDRAGILELGKVGLKAVAVAVRAPWEEVEPFLQQLITDGCIEIREDLRILLVPNFIAAQEANSSDKARQRTSRERARDIARARLLSVTVPSQGVTAPSHGVTNGIENGGLCHSDPTPPHPTPSDPIPSNGSHPTQAGGSSKESSFETALRLYSQFFAKRYGRPFMLTSVGKNSDETALVRIGRLAEAKGDADRWLHHWMRAYLRDGEPWLIENAHPPRQLAKRLNKYGEPKVSKPPAPAKVDELANGLPTHIRKVTVPVPLLKVIETARGARKP